MKKTSTNLKLEDLQDLLLAVKIDYAARNLEEDLTAYGIKEWNYKDNPDFILITIYNHEGDYKAVYIKSLDILAKL